LREPLFADQDEQLTSMFFAEGGGSAA